MRDDSFHADDWPVEFNCIDFGNLQPPDEIPRRDLYDALNVSELPSDFFQIGESSGWPFVFLSDKAADEISRTCTSPRFEQGGFLLYRLYITPDGKPLIMIADAYPIQSATEQSQQHHQFTITKEARNELELYLDDRYPDGNNLLISTFHSHPGYRTVGPSASDDIVFDTFQVPGIAVPHIIVDNESGIINVVNRNSETRTDSSLGGLFLPYTPSGSAFLDTFHTFSPETMTRSQTQAFTTEPDSKSRLRIGRPATRTNPETSPRSPQIVTPRPAEGSSSRVQIPRPGRKRVQIRWF